VTVIVELDHVSLFVRDRDASARFCGEVLGLPRSRTRPGDLTSGGSALVQVARSI
jgi:catechol 2,3-dioxygenase-like lactoylglutathione lyase family enzyme